MTPNAVDANNGFPASITDSADGLTLQPCTINATDCLAARPKPADPLSVGNFPPDGEMFYWAADPVFNGNLADIASRGTRFAIEGTFTGGKPVDGDQALFARMRFRFDLAPGHYRVTHPFGVETYDVAGTGGLKAVNDTRDYGCTAAPCDMGAINFGPVTGLLRWDDTTAPATFIGTPATPHTVTGAPTGNNFVRVERQIDAPSDLNPDGTWQLIDETSQFNVQGQLAGAPPAPVAFMGLADTSVVFPGRRSDVPSLAKKVVVSNGGGAPMTIGASVSGPNAADFPISGTCTGTVAAHSKCTIVVNFTAGAPIGPRSAVLNISSDAANLKAAAIDLTGTVTDVPPPPPPAPIFVTQVLPASPAPAAAAASGTAAAGTGGAKTPTATPTPTAAAAPARTVSAPQPAPIAAKPVVAPTTAPAVKAALRFSALSAPKSVRLRAARKGVKITMTLPKGASAVDMLLTRSGKKVSASRIKRKAGRSTLSVKITRRGTYKLKLTPRGKLAGVARTLTIRVI